MKLPNKANFVRTATVYISVFVFFSLLYILMFRTQLFSAQKILFYRGLMLLTTLTVLFLVLITAFSSKKQNLNFESLFAAVLVSASINLSIFVVFPVTFERSVTMYLLNILGENTNNSCRGLSKSQLESRLINNYIIEKKAVDKRLEEQKVINFLSEDKRCIQLTQSALNFLKFEQMMGKIYNINLSNR